jgi:hypothetical protein
MSTLVVPPLDESPWPTLGPQVCEFIRQNLIYGPGDLRGEPAELDVEKEGLIHRMYEVFPQGHPDAGRRRFRRVALSLRKGSAKTELAAWIAACELHPNGPVRCVGWEGGKPVGGGVTDPYIPMIAYTEEQSEELAYGTLLCVLSEGPLMDDFDCGLARIQRKDGTGRAVALSAAPGPRDGARTTYQVFDETHRLVLSKQLHAHRTMLANLPKRRLADPWSLEVTTAPAPGEGSVAEQTMDYAQAVAAGNVVDSKLFFFHRQASDKHDLETDDGLKAAIVEASGPVAVWSAIDAISEQWQDPTADRSYLERVWLNRPVRSADQAFDSEQWKELAEDFRPVPTSLIVLGFDGARFRDSTALMGCDVEHGHLFVLGLWEKPVHLDDWEVPVGDVKSAVEQAFSTWNVWRMYADPPYWESLVDEWAGTYGEDRVISWWTNRLRPVGHAVRAFTGAIAAGELTHDGNKDLARHIGNAKKKLLRVRDDEDKPLWSIEKDRQDSPRKIDAAMASVLAWEARGDAVAAGALGEASVYETRGVRYL